MRVYELSKQLGITNKQLLKYLADNNYKVGSHISVVPFEAIDEAKNFFLQVSKSDENTEKNNKQMVKKDASGTSSRSRNRLKKKQTSKSDSSKKNRKQVGLEQIDQKPKKIPRSSLTVGDFAEHAQKQVGEIILALLKQGIVAVKNQLLSKDIIVKLAHQYGLELEEEASKLSTTAEHEFVIEHDEDQLIERMPIVVVIGHVDHGKTTLLDYIRKTRVASREKGGITQHLGAYQVDTAGGPLVFLDTPGHEAFSLIRARGVKFADIAILIVAADDGVMPQTVEAIKHAQAAQLPIIVAINKIDKVEPKQIEAVKSQLAQYDLLPEDWGGNTVCLPISAKEGTGVDDLLDLLQLQAELMELKANIAVTAKGYILESKLKKGRGAVATVILQHGVLHVGDYFVAGKVSGKVSSLTDYVGKPMKEVGPSVPTQVAGFDALPQAGDPFEVVDRSEIKKRLSSQFAVSPRSVGSIANNEDVVRISLILKTDTVSSKEALIGAIEKISQKLDKSVIDILIAGIGDVTERDVMLAADTQSLIYTLHAKVPASLNDLIQHNKVKVKSFDIIYKLLEDLELVAKSQEPVTMVTKKIGEAVIIKTFNVKNIGTIAGALLKSGRFVRNGQLVIWRGKDKIGSADIKSLQREHKNVKEVHAGFEFAFLADGFQDWQLEDRVECFQEIPE